MSHFVRAIQTTKGYDKWSGRHPLCRHHKKWFWKKYTRRLLRYLGKREATDAAR